LGVTERARSHLQRVLSTAVGYCTSQGCNAQIDLYNFAYQQCPDGHNGCIQLYNGFEKTKGVGDAIVAGLAIIGGVALATELLNGLDSGSST
ncbi:MAG: hypothetical protein MUO19_01335, partial [Dehalococcoidales bacterium]|nr:hypothetical protein [Dehalococcoidales bacterium]